MKELELEIELVSDALPASGEGFGAIIDSDIVFDEVGLPFIPGRRIKGCLREAANEICFMADKASLTGLFQCPLPRKDKEYELVQSLFGNPGQEDSAPLQLSNFYMEEYQENHSALRYYQSQIPSLFDRSRTVEYFTCLRQQTAIDAKTGAAKKYSLRTSRVLKKGISFKGNIQLDISGEDAEKLLILACMNFKHFGSLRHRGFGEIKCRLHSSLEGETLKKLEELCNN